MRLADFSKPAGQFVPTIAGQRAFVPAALHPPLDLGVIAMSMSEANGALGELRGACRRLQNPYVLIRPLQRREALTSSAMEGTYTTEDNLLLAEVAGSVPEDDSTREVVNYIRALGEASALLRSLPLCHRVIKRAHTVLLSGISPVRGANKRPGEYKAEQNWIGGMTIQTARFVPSPPAEASTCMDQLEAYLNRNAHYPSPLMDLALAHYQFETIHPFADGNGRVGRMLISLMAVQSGLLDSPVLYISPAMERHKDEYIDRMYGVSATSAWEAWLVFFFERVTESCLETVATIDRLLLLQDRFRDLARQAGRSSSLLTLVDYLFEQPAVTVSDAANRLGVTYAAGKILVDKLVALDILRPIAGRYPRIYISQPIRRAAVPPGPGEDR